MKPISYKRHRFPPAVIRHAVWLYFRFTLSLRDVEDLLAERGVEVSYETVRCWTRKFGQQFAGNLRKARPKPTATWHLDEMMVRINGQHLYLWRAVDSEGEVLDMLVQKRRNRAAALRLLRKLLRRQGCPARSDRHRRVEILRGRGRHDRACAASPAGSAAREQSGGELASPHPSSGAVDAAVQVARLGPALPVHSCLDLQRLLHSAASGLPANDAAPSR